MSAQYLKNEFFELQAHQSGCVEKIVPLLQSARVADVTIGAIADENAVEVTTVKEFFDPKVSGDCVIHDQLEHTSFSLRHGQASSCFSFHQQWEAKDDYWEWSLEIKHTGGKERELKVELLLPHPIFPGAPGPGHSRWNLWMPMAGAPYGEDYGLKSMHCCKCIDEQTDTLIPLCTLYNPRKEANLGFSYLMPPEETWYVDFLFNQREWLTYITFKNIGLLENGKVSLKLWCIAHEGDWRPALGWVREKFPALLGSVDGQEKIDGNMAYTVAAIPKKRISDWASKMNLKWNEMIIYRDFSNFAPDEPFDASHFKTPEHPEWSSDNLTYDKVRKYVEMCHKHGVMVMPYFNVMDGESELVEKKFPESIARIFNGEKLPTWHYYDRTKYTLLMNCDPQYPYFDFILAQFEKLLKKIPEIDGFFFDQSSYGWIDTAHFDGLTFYNNKPAYNLSNAYLRAYKKMRAVFPRPRIIGMGNGPCRWQLMEYLDGAMAEGDPKALGRVSFLSPERPTICLAEGEIAFQNALYYGAWLHVSPYYRYPTTEPLPKEAVKLFSRYNPLFEFFKGRKWVYAPNPLNVKINQRSQYEDYLLNHDETVKANIFKTFWGEYAVVVCSLPKGMAVKKPFCETVEVSVKVPAIEKLKMAVVFGVDYKGFYSVQPQASADGYYTIRLPRHGAASMIILTENFDKLKSVCKWTKFNEEFLK